MAFKKTAERSADILVATLVGVAEKLKGDPNEIQTLGYS